MFNIRKLFLKYFWNLQSMDSVEFFLFVCGIHLLFELLIYIDWNFFNLWSRVVSNVKRKASSNLWKYFCTVLHENFMLSIFCMIYGIVKHHFINLYTMCMTKVWNSEYSMQWVLTSLKLSETQGTSHACDANFWGWLCNEVWLIILDLILDRKVGK